MIKNLESEERKKRILIIDDEEVLCNCLKNMLNFRGYDAQFLSQASMVSSKIEEEDFDLVLLDFIMPDMDGVAICKLIKKIKPATPVMAVSGSVSGEWISEFIEAGGMSTILNKPFDISELFQKVQMILH